MRFLLDTNVVSELRKLRPHGGVLAWYQGQHPEDFAIPSVALFELQVGVEMLRPRDAAKADELEAWIGTILEHATILPLDGKAARQAARFLGKQTSDLIADVMIAAIAKVNGLTVATRNVRDFERFDVPVIDPFLYR